MALLARREGRYAPLYDARLPIKEKIETIVRRVYGGDGVDYAPAAERDVRATPPDVGKRQNDIVFDITQFTTSYQEGGEVGNGRTGVPFFGDFFGHSMPQDGGLAPVRDAGGSGPGWHSINAAPIRSVTLTRADIDPGARTFLTFYAHVSDSTVVAYGLTLPHGGTPGSYGADRCGTATSGVRHGWDCDPSHWWRAPAASARPQNPYSHRPLGALVSAPFELRDVDCESAAGAITGVDCSVNGS